MALLETRSAATALLVARDKFAKGITRADTIAAAAGTKDQDKYEFSRPVEIEDLERQFATDAHFFCYWPTYDKRRKGQAWVEAHGLPADPKVGFPRVRKDALVSLNAAGVTLHCGWIAFDYDLPDHREWHSDEEAGKLLAHAMEVIDDWSVTSGRWRALYTTLHGFRALFRFQDPVEPEAYEAHYRWLVKELKQRGLEFDDATWDWTRCFRLPAVKRSKRRSEEEPTYLFLDNEDDRGGLRPADLGRVDHRKGMTERAYALVGQFQTQQTPPDDCLIPSLLGGDSEYARPLWVTEAKRSLRSREPYHAIFEGSLGELVVPGKRNNTLIRYVGIVCDACSNANDRLEEDEKIGAEQVYALMYECVAEMEDDDRSERWLDALWRMISMIWPKEQAKKAALKEIQEERELDMIGRLAAIGRRMRTWDKGAPDSDEEEILAGYVSERLIVSCGPSLFLLKEDGYYTRKAFRQSNLIPAIRKIGTGDLFPISYTSKRGEAYRNDKELLNLHSLPVNHVHIRPQLPGTAFTIRGNDILVKEAYRRKELAPVFSEEVDGWLRAMFGKHFQLAEQWLAWSLHFENSHPICAFSINGVSGIGKGLLFQGLVEATTSFGHSTDEDMFKTHAQSLSESAWLLVDEHWSVPANARDSAADRFRTIVGGATPIRVNPKYLAEELAFNPVRVVITANSLSPMRTLVSGRTLSKQDRHALATRILHFDLGRDGKTYLDKRNGNFRDMTSTWVGSKGRVLAQHLLYLHDFKRDPAARGARFLIEGNDNPNHPIHQACEEHGPVHLVFETVAKMAHKGRCGTFDTCNEQRPVVFARGKKEVVVFVRCSDLIEYYRDFLQDRVGQKISNKQMKTALDSLSVEDSQTEELPGFIGRSRWWRLSARRLLESAQWNGWPTADVAKLIEKVQREP